MNQQFIHKSNPIVYGDLETDHSDGRRLYITPDGKRYPSVTTVLSVINEDKDFLKAWRKAVGDEEADRVCRIANQRGTTIHETIEAYLKNESVDIQKLMPLPRSNFMSLKPILDEHVNNVYAQECALYSDTMQMAGRVDCVAEFDNVLSIIDFKTSKRIKTHEDISGYYMQETAYALMWYERTGIRINQMVTIMSIDYNAPAVFIEQPKNWIAPLADTLKRYRQVSHT